MLIINMSWHAAIISRFLAVFRRGSLDQRLDEEIGVHLDLLADEFERRGMTPQEARRAARRSFGGTEQIKEEHRTRRAFTAVHDVSRDIRHALRVLRRQPGFAIVATLTLAVGVTASSTLFTIIEAVGFRELPVHRPDSLVRIEWDPPRRAAADLPSLPQVKVRPSPFGARSNVFAYQAYRDFQRSRQLSAVIGVAPVRATARIDGAPQGVSAELVSGNYFQSLGVPVVRGRPITEADDRPAADIAVVLSNRYWIRRFGGDPTIVGKRMEFTGGAGLPALEAALLQGVTGTIVGIAGPGFNGVGGAGNVADLMLPLEPVVRGRGRSAATDSAQWWVHILGRTAEGATVEAIRTELAILFASEATRTGAVLRVESGSRGVVAGKLLGLPLLLMAPAALLLIIGCLNVSTLLLARSSVRVREMGVRNALGAGRRRIIQQLLTENMVLASAAGILAIVMAAWSKDVAGVLVLSTSSTAALETLALRTNAPVLGFTILVTVLTGVLCGVIPALRGARVDSRSLLAEHASNSGGPSLVTRFAIASQVALSVLLLIGSALLGRTLYRLVYVDPGFETRDLVRIDGLGVVFNGFVDLSPDQMARLRSEALERVRALPGVETLTMWRGSDVTNDNGVAKWSVRSDFFTALSVPIVSGRNFVAGERGDVAIINESMARRVFTGRDPIGEPLPVARGIQVVGVAKNVRLNGSRRGRNSPSLEDVPAAYYVPDLVDSPAPLDIAVRVAVRGDELLTIIRETVRAVHPNFAPWIETQEAFMARRTLGGGQFGNVAVLGTAVTAFGALSLLLVAVGLYGVTSYSTATRTREFGIRLALGAAPRTLLRQVQSEVFRLVGIGTLIGGALSVPVLMAFRRTLFGAVQPEVTAPLVALLVMVAVAGLAAYLPARRAAHVAPIEALRHD
jgi:predicted permease